MTLSNYQDRSKSSSSLNAGFQFEFSCEHCPRKWASPFKPYRRGQLTGLINKFGYFFANAGRMGRATSFLSATGERGAHDAALQEAVALAEARYFECPGCVKVVCEECWDDRDGRCVVCAGKRVHAQERGNVEGGNRSRDADADATAQRAVLAGQGCPNCQTALGGGRFCAECGFDMASTHKSCSACGTMCARSTRFCADCGHGF